MHGICLPIPFWKMSGAGNDFLVIDHRKSLIPKELMAEFARRVCRRKFSVGADGLFLIEASNKVDFKWRFFNADGSEAEMCGNGARCVARFAYMHGIAAARMQFETLAGIIDATVADTQVTIRMTSPLFPFRPAGGGGGAAAHGPQCRYRRAACGDLCR